MSVPSVTQTEQDGRLGALPPGSKALAIIGTAPSGTLNEPAAFGRTQDLVTEWTGGPLVHAAGYNVKVNQLPIVGVRCGQTTAATEDTIDVTGVAGTSVATYGADTTADDDYELYFKVITGGTIGTTGITFVYSKTGGRNLSGVTALGTATSFTFPNSGGVGFAFAAGTLVAGDIVRGRTHAPKPTGAELTSALTALAETSIAWDLVEICCDLDATLFDAIETAFASGKLNRKTWIGHARLPTTGESESAYASSITGVFSAKATTHGVLCAGGAKVTSFDGNAYRRPISHAVAARAVKVSPHLDLAEIDLGALPGVAIRNDDGNRDEHDELINPGLDDARFCTLRTHDGIAGVYVNNPRLFSGAGSDFKWMQHRRVMNLVREVTQLFFTRRLSKPILVSRRTGRILESSAVELETAASAAVEAVVGAEPMVSGGPFAKGRFVQVSRNDLILSTETLTVQCGFVPLAYPKTIAVEFGMTNPAVQVVG